MELILAQDLAKLRTDKPQSFYTNDELDLLHQLENGLIETKSHAQVMEDLRKKLGITEKMMKFDYNIVWPQKAEIKLFYQADYILQQSQNPIIAEQFYDAIKSEVDKLSFTADVYRLRKKKEIPILNGKYQVKFLIGQENVYIVDFKSARQNSYSFL
ncbi:Uncharacterised protein [Mannheimia haemolytica]|uniref:Uncharacterized protein n=2 Tax=Mannheimia haemolytica TaxID=75985 RepID=A0A378MTV8_MANHA|nr:Uncharacterised protein [Mannheimia haemolytica]